VVAVGEEFAGLVVDRDEAVVGLVAGGERGGDQLALALVGAEQSAGEVGEHLGGVEEVVALVGSGHLGDVLDGGLLSGRAGPLDAVLELLCLRPGLLGLVLLLLLGPRLVVGGDGLVLVAGVGGVVAAPAGRHRDEDGEGQQTGAAEAGDLADAALLRRLRHRRPRPERLGVAVSGLRLRLVGLLRLPGVLVAHASSLDGRACLWHVRPVEGMCGCTERGCSPERGAHGERRGRTARGVPGAREGRRENATREAGRSWLGRPGGRNVRRRVGPAAYGWSPTPRHSQRIAHWGACGKAPLVPQNFRPEPESCGKG